MVNPRIEWMETLEPSPASSFSIGEEGQAKGVWNSGTEMGIGAPTAWAEPGPVRPAESRNLLLSGVRADGVMEHRRSTRDLRLL